jgi:hypothetical protein
MMKISNKKTMFLISAIVVAVIGIYGCASTGIERSEKATSTMQSMDNDIKAVIVLLDGAGASLDELMRPGQVDVKKTFELYSKNIDKLISMEKQFIKHADEMKAKGNDYFEEWQKDGNSYKNSQIQALSEQRRASLSEIYGKIALNSYGVKTAFKEFTSDSKEVQSFLSNDLTSKGIQAIAPISRKVVNDGDNLKYALKNVQTAIDRARVEMAQSSK